MSSTLDSAFPVCRTNAWKANTEVVRELGLSDIRLERCARRFAREEVFERTHQRQVNEMSHIKKNEQDQR
jgi:hypothetical protein